MNCGVRKRKVKNTLILLHIKAYQCGPWLHDTVGILIVQIIAVVMYGGF